MARDDTHERCAIPEGAVITAEVEVVGYMLPGITDMKFAVRSGPDAPTSTLLGLMDLGKANLIQYAQERTDDETED